MRVLHKICGYAHLLIGTAEHEGDVPEDQVTISIFRAVKNPELFKKMEESGELVRTGTPGIYHVVGITKLPFQIVITGELEGSEYAACRVLTDKADEEDIKCVIDELGRETDDVVREYYGIYLNLVSEKNPKAFAEIRREENMKYPALMKIFEEDVKKEVDERVKKQVEEQVKKQVDERVKKEVEEQVKKEVDEQVHQATINYIKDIMASFGVTIEKAMDTLKIPQPDRAVYTSLVLKQ